MVVAQGHRDQHQEGASQECGGGPEPERPPVQEIGHEAASRFLHQQHQEAKRHQNQEVGSRQRGEAEERSGQKAIEP